MCQRYEFYYLHQSASDTDYVHMGRVCKYINLYDHEITSTVFVHISKISFTEV